MCFGDLVKTDLKGIVEIQLNATMDLIGSRHLVDNFFFFFMNQYSHNEMSANLWLTKGGSE